MPAAERVEVTHEGCSHTTVGENAIHARYLHGYHLLVDHDLSDEEEKLIRWALAWTEDAYPWLVDNDVDGGLSAYHAEER